MNEFYAKLLNDIKGEKYSTYRCLSSDIGNYALIGNIKHITTNNLNIYPIHSTFELNVISGGVYDEAKYSITIFQHSDSGEIDIALICLKESSLIGFCIDAKDNELNLYVSTTVAGGTVTVNELEKTGFIYWKNFNKFTMLESSFTNKINATFNTVTHDSIEINMVAGGVIYPHRDNSYHIGTTENKFRTIHLNDGVVCARTSAPSNPTNGMSFFYATIKKWVTYYDGVWYSATGEVVEI